MDQMTLQQTIPGAFVTGPAVIQGFSRVFELPSAFRQNPATGVSCSILNIREDTRCDVWGALFEMSHRALDDFIAREPCYDVVEVLLLQGVKAYVPIARTPEVPYEFVENDPIQREYLEACVRASKELGHMDNFLDSTFLNNQTLRNVGIENLLGYGFRV
jgi:hypothetical protein